MLSKTEAYIMNENLNDIEPKPEPGLSTTNAKPGINKMPSRGTYNPALHKILRQIELDVPARHLWYKPWPVRAEYVTPLREYFGYDPDNLDMLEELMEQEELQSQSNTNTSMVQAKSASIVVKACRKLAEIGGSGNDDAFEQAFSNLAHAYIREKAPNLEPHELGFQMLERSDDGERAAGITGFQVGNQLIYSPVFWLRGRIKGHELLFLKNLNMFVPMKENWLNYILQRKPPRIGESVSRNPRALGIRQPDLLRMTRTPYKYASVDLPCEAWVKDAFNCFNTPAPDSNDYSLPAFIKAAGYDGFIEFTKFAERAPELAEKAYEFHGDALLEALTQAAKEPRFNLDKVAKRVKLDTSEKDGNPTVQITTYSMILTGKAPADITDKEREEIMLHGLAVRDARKDTEVSRAYSEEPAVTIMNPTGTGLYDVITRAHGLKKALVVMQPWSPHGRANHHAVVVFVEDEDFTFLTDEVCKIFTTKQYENKDMIEFLNSNSKAVSNLLSDDEFDLGGQYKILMAPNFVASSPVRVNRKLVDDDETSYELDYAYMLDCDRAGGSRYHRSYIDGAKLVVDTRDSTHFRTMDCTLFVPSNTRVLTCVPTYSVQLGGRAELKRQLYNSMRKVAIFRDGDEVTIRSDETVASNITPVQAISHLVLDYGLRAQAAKDILKTADVKKSLRLYLKTASPYLSDEGPYSPAYSPVEQQVGSYQIRNGESVMMQEPYNERIRLNIPREPMPYHDQIHYVDGDKSMQMAQQAAQTGQKDVFDASVMTTMLRNMRDDQLIDRFIPALARAMDATGRLLYQFYWHQEDFADRYGDKDMPEMEDSLRNLFEGSGDIVLKLKQKTIDPYPDEQELGVSLTDLAGAS